MTYLTFASPSGIAQVSGTEQHYAIELASRIGSSVVSRPEDLLPFIPNLRAAADEDAYVRSWLASPSSKIQTPSGLVMSAREVVFNTALLIGGDVVRLITRLAGQSEQHLYVTPRHKLWLAHMITYGLSLGLLRSRAGWSGVVGLLEANTAEPVVTSFTGTINFPNHVAAGETEEEFDRLSPEKQWAHALRGLRLKDPKENLRLSPATWQTFVFGHGYDLIKLLHMSVAP